jgi:hypothetical protein
MFIKLKLCWNQILPVPLAPMQSRQRSVLQNRKKNPPMFVAQENKPQNLASKKKKISTEWSALRLIAL